MANEPQRPSEPQRPIQDHPGQRTMPSQRGSAHSTTATMSREYQTQERRETRAGPPIEHRPPRHHLPMKIAGIIGLLLLGGLIAGLVASHPVSTPSAPVAARTLSSFGAHGSATSPTFTVPSSPVTSTYGYSCPAGTSGRFAANLVESNGADSHAIVNTTSHSVTGSTTLHPAHVGSLYHVAVTAPAGCAYRINTSAP
jgi:hypothetical protein